MATEQQQLEIGIAALEAQRPLLGDAVVDAMLAPARAKLAVMAAALVAPPEAAQALKQVSILFLDVVGSTALSQHLDPEAISAVMDGALSRGTAVVEAHRGRVLQYAGDNLLAAFGVDASAEDDAERAVKCGLALLALGRTLGAEVQAAHCHVGFDVRVGVHTGGVLLGGGVDADGNIRGIAVNIAARMEQTAPAGALRISHDTYAQVRGLFEVDPQEPLVVKGVDALVPSYLVRSAKPRHFRIGPRGIEGMATRMIGRDAELEALQAAYRRLFAERSLAMVTVVADAGIGKSRLLNAFAVWSEARPERFFLFRGSATPPTGSHAYGLLRDILAWRFQIRDDDSLDAARKKMEDGIVPLFVDDDGPDLAEGHAHLLGHLIGIEWKDSRHIRGILDDAKQIRNRAFHAAAQIFRRVSAIDGSPVILQLEDLHWADSETLDFLNYLAEVNHDVPLLVMSFTRPTLFERRLDWSSTEGIHTRIDLQPLSKGYSRDLANELLKKLPDIPAALRELLTSSAEGNPFYMEELLKMLIDQRAIETGETWKVNAERLLVTKVPPTLTGVLQARLDGLPKVERQALQQASIVGTVFWDQALAAVEPQAVQHLPALVKRELTLPRADAALDGLNPGLREYAFRHQILHQVTYDTVLRRAKRAGHARVAQWLAELTEQGSLRAGDLLGVAAEHFEQAGDEANAAEFHARAAANAGQRLAHERVLLHVGRALALLGGTLEAEAGKADLLWRLLSSREQTLFIQARRDEQAAELDALERVAEALDDDRRRAEVARRRALLALRLGDWTAMEHVARHGMACAARAGDAALRLHTLRLLATARVLQGDLETGQTLARQGLAEARSLGLPDVEARMLNVLAMATGRKGDQAGALVFFSQGLRIYRELGDRINEAISLLNEGGARLNLGHLARAKQDLEAALQLSRANGDRVSEGWTILSLSTLASWQGDDTRALALARSAMDIAVTAQGADQEVLAGLMLGNAELALGLSAAALQAYGNARQRALEIDDPKRHDVSAGLARLAMADGDDAAALAALQPVLDHVASGGTLEGTEHARQIELTVHQVLARTKDPRAAEWLERAHDALIARADVISQHNADPAQRERFLQNIPHHRAIVAAWGSRTAACSKAGPTSS